MRFKICTKCKKKKQLIEFHKSSIHFGCYYPSCRKCKNSYKRKHYNLNKEICKEKRRINYIKNREAVLKTCKLYRQNNKKYYNDYNKNRRLIDTEFRLTHNLRSRINICIKGNTKSLSTMFLIGCEIDYLMYYIQEKFTTGMSWDNYGTWEIDHIKPCASFDLSKPIEQKRCFNYRNLQPLWSEDNRSKGSKILIKEGV